MTHKIQHPRYGIVFGFPAASILLSGIMIMENPYYYGIMLSSALVALFIFKFEYFFPLLLVVRSSLDIFTHIGFEVGPMNFNVPSALSIFIDIAGLLYLALQFYRGEILSFDDIVKAFLIWLLALLFWGYLAYQQFGENGLLGLREWTRLFSIFVIYVLSLQLVQLKGYKYLVHCSLWSLLAPILVGYYQMFFTPDISSERLYGTLAHPNAFSLYLTLFIAILIWKIKFSSRKFLWIGLLSILLFALVRTFSIGGMVMIGVFIVLIIHKEFEIRMKSFSISLLLLSVILFIYTDTGQKRIEELKSTPSFNDVVNGEVVTNSFTWRVVNWKLLYEKWMDNPWLGYGLNTAGFVNPWYMAAPHNDYLRFLVELGLVGFILTGWFFLRIWLSLVAASKSCVDDQKRYLITVMGIVFVAWMIGASVDNHITSTTFQFYFWAILACALSKTPENHIVAKP